jgi:hypothetical protein
MNDHEAVDAAFRTDREFLLRHELRRCDREQLETLLLMLCREHDLYSDIVTIASTLPRASRVEEPDDNLPRADLLITHEERRLGKPHP